MCTVFDTRCWLYGGPPNNFFFNDTQTGYFTLLSDQKPNPRWRGDDMNDACIFFLTLICQIQFKCKKIMLPRNDERCHKVIRT